jgi:hypothetical protein
MLCGIGFNECVVRMGHVMVSMGGMEQGREGKGERGMGMTYLVVEVCSFNSVFFVSANAPLICCPCSLRLYAAYEIFLMC